MLNNDKNALQIQNCSREQNRVEIWIKFSKLRKGRFDHALFIKVTVREIQYKEMMIGTRAYQFQLICRWTNHRSWLTGQYDTYS